MNSVTDWFGYIDQYGSKSISVRSIIDFFADPKIKNKKTIGNRVLGFLEDVIGGDASDHNNVIITDGNGNSVKIGYNNVVKDHSDLYSGSSVDFQGEEWNV